MCFNALSTTLSQRKVTHIYLYVQTGNDSRFQLLELLGAKLQGIVLVNHSWMKEDQQKVMVFDFADHELLLSQSHRH